MRVNRLWIIAGLLLTGIAMATTWNIDLRGSLYNGLSSVDSSDELAVREGVMSQAVGRFNTSANALNQATIKTGDIVKFTYVGGGAESGYVHNIMMTDSMTPLGYDPSVCKTCVAI
jgi:hypothetical protein